MLIKNLGNNNKMSGVENDAHTISTYKLTDNKRALLDVYKL